MPTTADENDILVNTYGVDAARLFRMLYESLTNKDWDAFVSMLGLWWNIYSIIAILVSCLFIIGFLYAKVKYGELSGIEQAALREAEARWAAQNAAVEQKNAKWEAIQSRVTEPSPESWRVAIIEADIMLDEVLTNAGYSGQTIGEKLKTANPQSFTTVQDAWSAHKVRNEIAHVGSDFVLTQKTAQETILQYERVFREFGAV